MTSAKKLSKNKLFPQPLKVCVTGDVHIGHPRIPMYDLCYHLDKYFLPKVKESNFTVLAGDVWDSLLTMSTETTKPVISIVIDLLKIADENNVVLRVLRGTFDHDRDQSTLFETLHEKGHLKNNFRYISTITCEYIEELGIRVLYIPDSLPYKTSDDCMVYIHKLLGDLGWTTVDYAIVHGSFEHRFPPGIPLPKCTFRHEQFKDLVTRYVLCNHIHTADFYKNILYSGSFERMVHGEEEKKGFIYLTDDGIKAKIQFIENADATKFNTFDLTQYTDPSEVVNQYEQRLQGYTGDTPWFVRIKHQSSEIRKLLANYTKQKYPMIRFSALIETQTSTTILDAKELFDLTSLTKPSPESLPQIVFDRVVLTDPTMTMDDVRDLLSRCG